MINARTNFCFHRAQTETSFGYITWMVIIEALPPGTQLLSGLHPYRFPSPHPSKSLQPGIPWQPKAHLPQGNCRKADAGQEGTVRTQEAIAVGFTIKGWGYKGNYLRQLWKGLGFLTLGKKNKIWRTESAILKQLGIHLKRTKHMWSMKSQTLKLRTQE